MRAISCILFFFVLLFESAKSQLIFDTVPTHMHFYARQSNGYGRMIIAGKFKNENTRSAIVRVTDKTKRTFYGQWQQENKTSVFKFIVPIPARLSEFDVEILYIGYDNTETHQLTIRDVVAGDLFLLFGQSNAAASPNDWTKGGVIDSMYVHPCSRVLGTEFDVSVKNDLSVTKDAAFKRPSCRRMLDSTFGYLGVWPIKLQHDIMDSIKVPVCFVNITKGATQLNEHFASNTPSDPSKLFFRNDSLKNLKARLYDRIYKRISYHGLESSVKAVFFFQGESDANTNPDYAKKYQERFDTLYNSWKADYPNIAKIFLFQVNTGCAGFLSIVREAQRRLPLKYPDVVVMSSLGTLQHERNPDGCHYSVEGYCAFADKIIRPALKHLYQKKYLDSMIMPPDVVRAFYSARDEISVEFDKNITAEDSTVYKLATNRVAYLKDYFYTASGSKIEILDTEVSGAILKLKLSPNNGLVTFITWLPDVFTTIPSVYSGPWIRNAINNELAALSFRNMPVSLWKSETIQVFPNPAQNKVIVNLTGAQDPQTITIYNSTGEFVNEISVIENGLIGIDLSAYTPGVYLLKIKTGRGSETKKLLVY